MNTRRAILGTKALSLSATVVAFTLGGSCTQRNSHSDLSGVSTTRALLGIPTGSDGLPVFNIVDGDTETGIPLSSRQVFAIPLMRTARVIGVAAYVTGPVKLAARLQDGAYFDSGPDGIVTPPLGGGWVALPAVADAVSNVKLSIEPANNNVSVRELAVWADGTSPMFLPAQDLSARLQDPSIALFIPEPDHGTLAPAGTGDADRGFSTCVNTVVYSPIVPGQVERVLVAFEARNVADSYSVELRVNEFGPVEALLVPSSSELKNYYRRFSASWLKTGRNEISLCGPTAGAVSIQVQGILLIEEAWRAPIIEPDLDSPEHVLVDGRTDARANGDAFYFAAQRPFVLHAVTLRNDGNNVASPATIEVDGQQVHADLTAAQDSAQKLIFTKTILVRQGVALQGALRTTDVEITASPVGPLWPRPVLVFDHPHNGAHVQGMGAITGFVDGFQGYGNSTFVVNAASATILTNVETATRDGAFALLVNRAAMDGPFDANVTVIVGDNQLTRHAVFVTDSAVSGAGTTAGRPTPGLDPALERRLFGGEGDQARATVTVQSGGEVVLGERVRLTVPAGAANSDGEMLIRRPPRSSLARLNPGMVNVTAPQGAGYEFLPSGTRFKAKVTITIPYEPTLIPSGKGAQDVRTYFYSLDQGEYVPLERVLVDPNQQVVQSLTDHFTDMINAVLVQPESTTPQSFNPNRVTGLAVANPTANMTIVAPPTPNKDGTANISYPIQLPKSRGRYQPQVALSYSSEGGWGLAGEGWNLSVPTIDVDTRFGAARYEAPPAGPIDPDPLAQLVQAFNLPTPPANLFAGERYLLDGQQLVPVDPTQNTGACLNGDARGTLFRLRKEGRFARIVRCRSGSDTNPHDDYYWIVTEKDGTQFVYGWDDDSRLRAADACPALPPGAPPISRNIGRWYLDHVIDADGNGTLYTYNINDEPCGTPPKELAAERTLRSIEYTFFGAGAFQKNVTPTANYAVEFTYNGRSDQRIDGKLGFLNQQTQRLSAITVRCRGSACGSSSGKSIGGGGLGNIHNIRQYALNVHAPDVDSMFKTRLDSVQSCVPDCGTSQNRVPDPTPDQFTSFFYVSPSYKLGNPDATHVEDQIESWQLPSDSAGGLNATQGFNIGASAGAGIGPVAAVTQNIGIVLSGTLSGSLSANATMVSFMDLNGDGLPDQVVSTGNQFANAIASGFPIQPAFGSDVAFNTGVPGTTAFRRAPRDVTDPTAKLSSDQRLLGPVLPPPVLSQDLSIGLSVGANLHVGADYLGADGNAGANVSISASVAFPTDVNGDGLIDFAGPVNLVQRRTSTTVDGGVLGAQQMETMEFVPELPIAGAAGTCAVPATIPGISPPAPSLPLDLNPLKLLDQIKEIVSHRDQVIRWRAPRSGKVTVAVHPTPLLVCDELGGEKPKIEAFFVPNPPLPHVRAILLAAAENGFTALGGLLGSLTGTSSPTALQDLLDARAPSITPPISRTFDPASPTIIASSKQIDAGAEILVRIPSTNRCAAMGGLADAALVDVIVTYDNDNSVSTTDPTGQSQYTYNSTDDFRVVGNATPLILPYKGQVHVTGGVRFDGDLADDVTIRLVSISCTVPTPGQFSLPDVSNPDVLSQVWTLPPNALQMPSPQTLAPSQQVLEKFKAACPGVANAMTPILVNGGHHANEYQTIDKVLDINAGTLLAVVVEGKTLIDTKAITIVGADRSPGRFNAIYQGQYWIPDISTPEGVTSKNDNWPSYEVPVSIGWRRLVPFGGAYRTVTLQGDKKIHLDMIMAPSSWVDGNDDDKKAHLIVQSTDGKLLARTALAPNTDCPLPPLPSLDDLSSGCPVPPLTNDNPPRFRCIDLNRFKCEGSGCSPLKDTLTECKDSLIPCPGQLPDFGGGICTTFCALSMADVACVPPGCTCSFHPPPGVPAPQACNFQPPPSPPSPCDVVKDALRLGGGVFAKADVDLSNAGLNDGQEVFISLEPGTSALFGLWPAPWDIGGVLEKLNPANLPTDQWVLSQALLLIPNMNVGGQLLGNLAYQLKIGGQVTDSAVINRLIPDGTWGLPLPIPLFSTIGAIATEGYRNWSYAEFMPLPGPDQSPDSRKTLAGEFAALNLPAVPGILKNPGPWLAAMQDVANAQTFSDRQDKMNAVASLFAYPDASDPNHVTFPSHVEDGLKDNANLLVSVLSPFNLVPQLIPVRPTGQPLDGQYVGLCPESTSARGVVTPGRCIPKLPMKPSMFQLGPLPDIKTQALQIMACPVGAPKVTVSGGANLGETVLGFGASYSAGTSMQLVDYRDMNGDGIPDIVIAPNGPLLVLRADRSPGALVPYKPLFFGFADLRRGLNGNASLNGDLKPAGKLGLSVFGASQVSERLPSSPTPSVSVALGAEAIGFQDINGDGLPDWISSLPCDAGGFLVRLNLGSRLEATPRCWGTGEVALALGGAAGVLKGIVPMNLSVTLEGQVGISAAASALPRLNGVHGNVSGSTSNVHVDLQDINGDGLLDRVFMFDDKNTVAYLGNGQGFEVTPVRFESVGWTQIIASGALDALQKQSNDSTDSTLGIGIPIVNQPLRINLGSKSGKTIGLFGPTMMDAITGGPTCTSDFCKVASSGAKAIIDNWALPDALSTTTTFGFGGGAGVSSTMERNFQIAMVPIVFGVTANGGANVGGTLSWSNAVFVDINGDGAPEPVRLVTTVNQSGQIVRSLIVKKNQIAGALKLQKITNPLGGTITLSYEHAGNTFDMPQHRWVLSQIVTNSGEANGVDDGGNVVNGGSLTTVRYEGGKFDRYNKDFRGFEHVIVEERALSGPFNTTGTKPRPPRIVRSHCTQYDVSSYERAGLVTRNATYSGLADCSGTIGLLEEETTEYTRLVVEPGVNNESLCPRPAPLPADEACRSTALLMAHTSKRSFEAEGPSAQHSLSVVSYDAYGNAIQVVDHKRTDDPTDDISMMAVYAPVDGDRYLAALPTTVLISNAITGELMRVRNGTYDTNGNITSWEAVGDTGRLRNTYDYDSFGNRIRETGPSGYEVDIGYDRFTNTLPVLVQDKLDVSEGTEYNLALQAPLRVIDANGAELAMDYDARGRLAALYGPVDTTGAVKKAAPTANATLPLATVNYGCVDTLLKGDQCAEVTQLVGNDASVQVFTYVDRLGREHFKAKTATQGAARGYALTGIHYADGLGRKVAVSLTKFAAAAELATAYQGLLNPTLSTFDERDRPTLVRAPSGTDANGINTYFDTFISYHAEAIDGVAYLATHTLDANREFSMVLKDPVQDQTALVREYPQGGTGDPPETHRGVPAETRYLYDGLNDLLFIHDAAGNQTSFLYDKLGRRTQMSTPDTGTTTYRFDAAGRPSEVENVLREIVRQEYEPRTTRVSAVRMVKGTTVTTRATYTYGQAGAAGLGVGRIIARTDEDGSDVIGYDALGNVASVARTITSTTANYQTSFTWDAFGRALDVTYPGKGERVIYRYDPAGQVISAAGDIQYVNGVQYDEFGQRTAITFGSGVVQAYSYDGYTRRLVTLTARTAAASSGASDLIKQRLYYDSVGNIAGVNVLDVDGVLDANAAPTVLPNKVKRVYTYDHLHRLETADTQLTLDGYSIPKRQWSKYEFDAIHNMKTKTQQVWGTDGVESQPDRQFFSYAYPKRPHTLDALTQQTVGATGATGTVTYNYVHDAAGRLTQSGDWRGARTFTWAPDNMMLEAHLPTETVTYSYDAQGNRVGKASQSKGVFHYLGPQATVTPSGMDRHVWVGSTRIATVVDAATPVSVNYITDHIGSTTVVLNSGDGTVREYLALDPYGGAFHDVPKGAALDEQFLLTGQQFDPETRLYWFQSAQFTGGGRYFDEDVVRWMSPDPEWSKQGPSGLSLFMAMKGSPVALVDSNGRDVVPPSNLRVLVAFERLKANSPTFLALYNKLNNNPNIQVNFNTGPVVDDKTGQPIYGQELYSSTFDASKGRRITESTITINLDMHSKLVVDDRELMDTVAHELGHSEDTLIIARIREQRNNETLGSAKWRALDEKLQEAVNWRSSGQAHGIVSSDAAIMVRETPRTPAERAIQFLKWLAGIE